MRIPMLRSEVNWDIEKLVPRIWGKRNWVIETNSFKNQIHSSPASTFVIMKAVIQRVLKSSIIVDGKIVGAIETGLLVLLGIEDADTDEDIAWLSNKIVHLRIFNDGEGVMNKSVLEIDGNILLVSQFTLFAHLRATLNLQILFASFESRPYLVLQLFSILHQCCF